MRWLGAVELLSCCWRFFMVLWGVCQCVLGPVQFWRVSNKRCLVRARVPKCLSRPAPTTSAKAGAVCPRVPQPRHTQETRPSKHTTCGATGEERGACMAGSFHSWEATVTGGDRDGSPKKAFRFHTHSPFDRFMGAQSRIRRQTPHRGRGYRGAGSKKLDPTSEPAASLRSRRRGCDEGQRARARRGCVWN